MLAVALVGGAPAWAPTEVAAAEPMQGGPPIPGAGPCPVGRGQLPDDARAAVDTALADERRLEAQYAAISERLGAAAPNPFLRIMRVERRHVAELEGLLSAHHAPIPAPAAVPVPNVATPSEACAFGVASERENVGLYGRLLAGRLPEDVSCLLSRMRDASEQRHLPAFESCAASR